MKVERVKRFEYCLPYFSKPPREEDELPQSTVVDVLFPSNPPVCCEFDWEFENLEEFTNERIEEGRLSEEQRDEFKEFVQESVREARRANREARDARRREVEEMSQETREVFENMRLYKFYPQNPPDFARNMQKVTFINRYYGNAHQVL
ncbi:BnaCnng16570D [Brassica napus]|uniref:BnaCnng16570D protein n=2 Tax=Brassica napus TaxID=3708 RepID=A0A078IHQ0_BRANA|nr:BnaCnng16570D [Brassica napus]